MKRTFKVTAILAVVLALFLSLAACGGSNDTASTPAASSAPSTDTSTSAPAASAAPEVNNLVMRVASTLPEDQSYAAAMGRLAQQLEERTDGAITYELYFNGAIGNDSDIFEAMQAGSIEAATFSTASASSYSDEAAMLGVLDLPFMYTEKDACYTLWESDWFKENLMPLLDSTGVCMLGMLEDGSHSVMSTNKPLLTLADYNGVKMRSLGNTIHQNTWKALGCLPTVIATSDLYTSLQQGVIDAFSNTPSCILTKKWYEPCKYCVVDTGVLFYTDGMFFSQTFLDSLTDEQRSILNDLCDEIMLWQKDNNVKATEDALKAFEDYGIELSYMADADKAAMREACQPVYDTFIKDYNAADVVSQVETILGK
jgi:TRAP-type C4-dicarboxylate transport system substrate-binding protein